MENHSCKILSGKDRLIAAMKLKAEEEAKSKSAKNALRKPENSAWQKSVAEATVKMIKITARNRLITAMRQGLREEEEQEEARLAERAKQTEANRRKMSESAKCQTVRTQYSQKRK